MNCIFLAMHLQATTLVQTQSIIAGSPVTRWPTTSLMLVALFDCFKEQYAAFWLEFIIRKKGARWWASVVMTYITTYNYTIELIRTIWPVQSIMESRLQELTVVLAFWSSWRCFCVRRFFVVIGFSRARLFRMKKVLITTINPPSTSERSPHNCLLLRLACFIHIALYFYHCDTLGCCSWVMVCGVYPFWWDKESPVEMLLWRRLASDEACWQFPGR
jgi:hypothetical protein